MPLLLDGSLLLKRRMLSAESRGGQRAAGLADSTHVVLWHRQQERYGEAAAAGKPVASVLWLYGCAEAGRLLPATPQVWLGSGRQGALYHW